MKRVDIIEAIGREWLTANIENGEYSYPKAYDAAGMVFEPVYSDGGREYRYLDLRFVDPKNKVAVLVETKDDLDASKNSSAEGQLAAYVAYEKKLTGYKTVAILASTATDTVRVWRGAVADGNLLEKETAIRSMAEYVDLYLPNINNKEKVMASTYALNNLLHKYSVPERLRSQLVGSCLLALKNGLVYDAPGMTAKMLLAAIKETLEKLLDTGSSDNKKKKIDLLSKQVFDDQRVKDLKVEELREILGYIEENILPYINDRSTAGQDLLNLFFTTFNKYVGKDDKNQAFTPDHITDFMAKVAGVDARSRVADITAGSGSFLVRAMTIALDDCATAADQDKVKADHIYGVEYDEKVAGLLVTNMLIHGDGNSNIIIGSCFDPKVRQWLINKASPTVWLLNVPFNAQRSVLPEKFTKTWKKDQKEDPSKGFIFAKYIAELASENAKPGKLAILLPVACAIGSSKVLKKMKKEMLEIASLDAVFTLPADVFYPGASASACCMVFDLAKPHRFAGPTFFGYYKEDGFRKKKNLGRVEQRDAQGNGLWPAIEREWLELYRDRRAKPGLSAVQRVTAEDEWLCEAYMETDYSTLTEADFQKTVNDYMAYLVKLGRIFPEVAED